MNRIFTLGLAAVILFFGWKASPVVTYFQGETWETTLSSGGGFRSWIWFLFDRMQLFMIAASVLLIVEEFIDEAYSPEGGSVLFIGYIAWAILGWYTGNQISGGSSPPFSVYVIFSNITFLLVAIGLVRLYRSYSIYRRQQA